LLFAVHFAKLAEFSRSRDVLQRAWRGFSAPVHCLQRIFATKSMTGIVRTTPVVENQTSPISDVCVSGF